MPEFDSTIRYAPIPDYPDYVAGTDGSIWSCRTLRGKRDESQWHQLVPVPRGNYLAVLLYSAPNQRKLVNIHIAILRAFIGPPPPGFECRHLNGNNYDCRLENIAWGTKLENHADKQRHGTTARGERHGQSKLKTSEVVEIRSLHASGMTIAAIARKFNRGETTIRHVVLREYWKHVT